MLEDRHTRIHTSIHTSSTYLLFQSMPEPTYHTDCFSWDYHCRLGLSVIRLDCLPG